MNELKRISVALNAILAAQLWTNLQQREEDLANKTEGKGVAAHRWRAVLSLYNALELISIMINTGQLGYYEKEFYAALEYYALKLPREGNFNNYLKLAKKSGWVKSKEGGKSGV